MSEHSLKKILSGSQSFFLLVDFSSPETDNVTFDLVMTDAINAWTGKIDTPTLNDFAGQVGEDLDKYVEETKKALMKQRTHNATVFEYQVKSSNDGGKQLSWKRVMSEDKIKFQLGSLSLTPSDDPSVYIQKILQHSIDHSSSQESYIKRLEMENDRLAGERGQALQKYEKVVKQKEQLEEDLYSKFCVLLNEKKAKIRQLKATDHSQNENAPSTSGVKRENEDRLDVGDERQDGEDEVSTDEEKEVSRKRPKKAKADAPTYDRDDSLILAEAEEENAATKGRRRKRQTAPKADVTPSKPSIPKVPSVKGGRGTPTTPRQLSNQMQTSRKTPSGGRRGRSADMDDASDLFDEM